MEPQVHVEIKRVAPRFYTWAFRYGDKVTIGYGPKSKARVAVRSFLLKHGGHAT